MKVTLTFHGAAGCVTGSCYLLKTPDSQVLIDCGLFQGPKTLKALNYNAFPFPVNRIDAVLLTHAHIDHSGQLPKLVRAGFRGPVFATDETRELCDIMLADCGHIQEMEVEHLNRRNAQRGRPPVAPIYTARDAARTLRSFETVPFDEWRRITGDIRARWWRAGHMLGAASIEVEVARPDGRPLRLLFSGDIGATGSAFLAGPEGPVDGLDHLVMESTYGGTDRATTDPAVRRKALADEMIAAHRAGGPLLMPAFAVERTQELLADLLQIIAAGEAPPCEMFLDSPLAIKACDIFFRHGWTGENNPFQRVRDGGHLHFLEKPWDSDRLEKLSGWHLIMAGSGMCDAGRVRRHLKRLLWRRETTVLLTGFQAAGTLGRLLQEGRSSVRIQGEPITVSARIRSLDIYSGHADAAGLEAWARARGPVGGNLFLCHGEPEAIHALKARLAPTFGQRILTPALDDSYTLEPSRSHAEVTEPRLPADAPTTLDWHNRRSDFLTRLDEQLEHLSDDTQRAAVLKRLQDVLTGRMP
jgi:metallo-beta-lactamase family protein